MLKFFQDFKTFVSDVSADPRIPKKDKAIVVALLALIISPVDFIPDWIPVIGQLDDFVMIALVVDYFFTVLDHEILLSHYPWGMKSFTRLRAIAKLLRFVIPKTLKKRLWSYVGSPY